jgi:hypothetical protein
MQHKFESKAFGKLWRIILKTHPFWKFNRLLLDLDLLDLLLHDLLIISCDRTMEVLKRCLEEHPLDLEIAVYSAQPVIVPDLLEDAIALCEKDMFTVFVGIFRRS